MWNDIELLTSDDTGSGYLSVGSRKEHGTALYQVDLLAKISTEKASLNPKIQAFSLSDGFIIVADQSVILLDSICRSLQLHLIFDTEVDVVGLCQEGKFLLVGERSGNLHFIHVTSKQTLLTNAFVQKANDENQRTYRTLVIEKDGSSEGTYYMLLLTNNGFFCITNIQLVKIQQAIENVDFNKAKKGTGDCAFSKWEPDPLKKEMTVKNVIDAEMIKGAKKFQLIDNLLFVLDTDNVLSLWDIYTLTPIWNWPSLHVEDFLLTTEADSPSSVTWQGITNLKLVALTTTTNKKMKNLMVYSLPMMEILYSLEVSSVSSLVQTGISTDTIYLLEGICKNDPKLPEDSVSVLVLRCLTEALPENRLSRLLHKHRFAEAESFAIHFGLDVELVYKVKSNDILEKLALSSVDSSEQTEWQTLVDEAKETLHKIQDDEFVVNYCLEAQWITYETTQEMLNYAKTRLLKKEDRTTPVYSYGLKEVLRAHAKLTTFYGAFGPEKFSGSSWIEFLNNEDDLKDIFLQLREGNLVCAQYLWLRHRANFESRFDVKMLENLLNSISTPVSLQKLCPWLKNDVIPFVRRIVPDGQKILAKWLEQTARNLELTDKANWPENGLQLAEVFFTAEKPDEMGLVSSWHWISLKDYENTEEVCQLRTLVNNLRELITLHRKYNCRLALSDFEKENTTTIVFRMFDKVLAPELIPSILEKFIRVYMREHDLQEEELLLLYIEDLLKRCSSKSTSLFETAWEAKAMAVIGCLSDTENPSEIFELQEDEALRRVLYLLLSRPIDYSSRMLFIFATSAKTTLDVRQLTFAHRARALQCLLYLADKETIESLFKKPIEEVKSYLKCITFLASFETLNIPITYELFCNSPKEGMIKGLWKNHSHESMAVRLVTELCLEYKIYDLQLWNGLLQKLLGFNMILYLRKVLTAISSIHSLWQVPYFSKAWQRVVQIPLLSASCPLSPSQVSDCCQSLIAVLECPVSGDLDMIGVARQYVQLELPAFALACLMLMPHSEKRHQQIKNFLNSCNPQIILQQLEEHMSTGQLAGFSHQIRNLVLNNIINKKEFGILAKTKYFQALKLHTMNTNNITDLVNYLANELSLDEASVFVTEYSKHRGNPVPTDAAPCEILKMFLNGS
uniref:Kinetochore associated 1 n=1 Tax=Molossus molossus TaxID=27622 RepID=A0A7J8BY72_MOLMO|nr:kinetochore associated 1 [Molossus molossus]